MLKSVKGLTLFFSMFLLICLTEVKQVEAKEEVVIPESVKESCIKYGEEFEVNPALLMSICWQESTCRDWVKNKGCIGMCQINPRFYKEEMELLEVDDLYDAEQNIKLCAYIIKGLLEEENDPAYALMCYNCGSTKGKEIYNNGKITKYAKEVIVRSVVLSTEMKKVGNANGR